MREQTKQPDSNGKLKGKANKVTPQYFDVFNVVRHKKICAKNWGK